jgi:hypothetical protein|eukprot:SAG25_NODE_764_length_5503_cov_13.115470_7_plen_494_part_00
MEVRRRRVLTLLLTLALPPHSALAGPASAADCLANKEAVVVHGDARFTILTDRVVRAERAPFVDDCTFTIVRRAMRRVPNFTVSYHPDGDTTVLVITTPELHLMYNASAAAGPPPPATSCLQGSTIHHGVQQLGGRRTTDNPDGLMVADEAACCAACTAAGSSCVGWVFREQNETTRLPRNCWTMRSLGEISPSSSPATARTIGARRPPSGGGGAGGFSAASLSINGWRPGMVDEGNLGGTISSWNEVSPRDLLAGNASYQPGVLSRSGWAVVDDSVTPRFSFEPPLWQGTQPWFGDAPPAASATADLYFFGCGTGYKACLRDFVALSGPVPLPPLATFGVWWSHYETYDEETIRTHVLEKFVEYDLPLNVLQMDCGWHLNNTSPHNPSCQGYNGYDWNEVLFPDPAQFVSEVKAGSLSQGIPLKLLLNTHNFLVSAGPLPNALCACVRACVRAPCSHHVCVRRGWTNARRSSRRWPVGCHLYAMHPARSSTT